jgi:hypothetical protein
MDVSIWLRDLGLEDYAQAFQANHIDAKVLPRLTTDELTALGITSVGLHLPWRRRNDIIGSEWSREMPDGMAL